MHLSFWYDSKGALKKLEAALCLVLSNVAAKFYFYLPIVAFMGDVSVMRITKGLSA